MTSPHNNIRIAIYGAGSWANRTHIPNLLRLDGVEIVALCDTNPQALKATAEAFQIPRTYQDGHEMLARERIDVLYSVVPAFARSDVEAAAAAKGIHLFSEKPQATTMKVARAIDAAVRQSGVLSTVCFRERYRPLFQEARRRLQDKQVVHVRFQSIGGLLTPPPPESQGDWHVQMEKAGGSGFDWGVHAVDYTRFMTGLNVVRAQAFYHHPPAYHFPLSSSFHFRLSNGATMTMTFLLADPTGLDGEAWFTIVYEGGRLAVYGYDRIEVNGETVYKADEFDPWFEQDRVFIEAVRTGDRQIILNDYHDGLFSLAPVLAGWESSRRNGECIDVASFMEA
ncbi:MAG: Gfo/Idh/MocA family oxidoreductase [Candidatus Latescibacteria bacterium]|nr:Gfo/Idh/MocA family oxidoreductase [Candidatus Latescibacterota bacterium]